jgi:hypothetical protein
VYERTVPANLSKARFEWTLSLKVE